MFSQSIKRSYSAATNVSTVSLKLVNTTGAGKKQGLAHLLSRYNFLDTADKSGLRLVRESEVIGGTFQSTPLRDGSIELKATFLKENLPYFLEALNNTVSKSAFKKYQFDEEVIPAVLNDYVKTTSCSQLKAKDLLYQLTFKNSVLGQPVAYDQVDSISHQDIKEFASKLYSASNAVLTTENVEEAALKQFIAENDFLKAIPAKINSSAATKSYVGESAALRFASGSSTAAIAIPVAEKDFATYETLKNFVTSPLFKASKDVSKVEFETYADKKVGVFSIYATGQAPAAAIKSIVEALKKGVNISGANKFTETFSGVKSNATTYKLDKFNYVAVGKTTELPTINEL
ncbi:hypothetical protein ACO0OL_000041 [Hanseniaspora opuntiae]